MAGVNVRENLTDKAVLASAFEVPAVGGYLAPKTFGLTVRMLVR